MEISRRSMAGLGMDQTRCALYYHADYVAPCSARVFEKTTKIGRHLFYKPAPS